MAARARCHVKEKEADVELPMQPALLAAHNAESSCHRAFGAADGEARPQDGELHGFDDREHLKQHAEQSAHHAQALQPVRNRSFRPSAAILRIAQHVPRRLYDASEGKSRQQSSICAYGRRILRIEVELTLLNLSHAERQYFQVRKAPQETAGCACGRDLEHVQLELILQIKLVREQHVCKTAAAGRLESELRRRR